MQSSCACMSLLSTSIYLEYLLRTTIATPVQPAAPLQHSPRKSSVSTFTARKPLPSVIHSRHLRFKGVACVTLTFALSSSKQEALVSGLEWCECNGCEGLAVRSVVSVWGPISEDPQGRVIKKESIITEYLWSA